MPMDSFLITGASSGLGASGKSIKGDTTQLEDFSILSKLKLSDA